MTGIDALAIIGRYKQNYLFRPYRTWLKYDFMYRSYIRWVTDEIYALIAGSEEDDPREIVSQFMMKMDDFVECSKQSRTQTLFSIARDGARDILELLDKYEWLKGESQNEYQSIDELYEEDYDDDAQTLAWYSDICGNQWFCDDGRSCRSCDAGRRKAY